MANNDASSSNADPQHDRMGRITQSVKDPEGMSIPSFVRLEPTKERLNFFRQVAAVSFDPVFNVTGRLGDRKHRSFRAHFPRDNRRSVGGLIANRTQCEQGLKSKIVATDRQPFGEFELMDLVDAISIQFHHQFVWLVKKEPLDLPVKIDELLLCSQEPPLGTIKKIGSREGHGATEGPMASDGLNARAESATRFCK